jgi:hypothetical protein
MISGEMGRAVPHERGRVDDGLLEQVVGGGLERAREDAVIDVRHMAEQLGLLVIEGPRFGGGRLVDWEDIVGAHALLDCEQHRACVLVRCLRVGLPVDLSRLLMGVGSSLCKVVVAIFPKRFLF